MDHLCTNGCGWKSAFLYPGQTADQLQDNHNDYCPHLLKIRRPLPVRPFWATDDTDTEGVA